MISNKTADRYLADIDELKRQLKKADDVNVKLMALEMELTKKNEELAKDLDEALEVSNKAMNLARTIDKARKEKVMENIQLKKDNAAMREIIANLEDEDKLEKACWSCKYCEDDGVSCCCPEDCFYAVED